MSDRMYNVCNFLQRGTFQLFADISVSGKENIPPEGPVSVVANHQSNIDPPLLAPLVPRRLRFLAKDTLFKNPISSWFLHAWGAHPLNRDSTDVKAIRWALAYLQNGGALVLFPEGTRHPRGMGQAQVGVAQFAFRTGAPLLPIGITGTEAFRSVFRVFKPSAKMTVTIGTPFYAPKVEGRPSASLLRSTADMIMRRIADLLPPSYRGVYADEPATVAGGA